MRAEKVVRRLGVGFALALLMLMAPLPKLEFVAQAVAATVELPPAQEATPEEMAEVQQAADEPLGEERVQATEESTREFSLMAVVFDTVPDEPVLVRVDDGEGNWGEWRELHVSEDEGPDDATNYGTEPFWVGASGAYEVNLDALDAADAEVVLVRNEVHRTVGVSEEVAGASLPAPFGVNSRASWGARPVSGLSEGSSIKKAIVHHTVSSNSYSQSQVPGIIAGIQAYHIDGRGWSDIGYNFLVDKYGGIWEGRAGSLDGPVIGAHAAGFNTNTVGISVLGDYTAATPSGAALEGVARVAGWKLFLGGQEPTASAPFTSLGGPKYAAGTVVNLPNVVGHRDVGSTSCPGSIHSYLGQIRNRAQDWFAWSRYISGPTGNLEAVAGGGMVVAAAGWAHNPVYPDSPVDIILRVGGKVGTGLTDRSRPDVAAANPGFPDNTGFSVAAQGVPPGIQRACVSAVNKRPGGSDLEMGCRSVRVTDPTGKSADGRFTYAAAATGRVQVAGWTSDVDGPAPRGVSILVDGRVRASTTTGASGTFNQTITGIASGRRSVCVRVANGGAGYSTVADCRTLTVAPASPKGRVDAVATGDHFIRVVGWALDLEATGPIPIEVALSNGWSRRSLARVVRRDVAAANPGYSPEKGFIEDIYGVPSGAHTVCAKAINVGGGSDTLLGCSTAVVK